MTSLLEPPQVESLEHLSTLELSQRCSEERARNRRGEPASDIATFELYRRAICDADNAAWNAIVEGHRGLVLAWIHRHPAANLANENDECLMNSAFERFWVALKPERWAQFPDAAAVLRYLKLCAHSVVLDSARAAARRRVIAFDDLADGMCRAPEVDQTVLDALSARELWDLVVRLLPDATERLIAELSFVYEWKPQKIQALHPDRFETIWDVYRIKRNAIDRLRRCPEMRQYITP